MSATLRVATALVAALVFTALFAPWIAPHDPAGLLLADRLKPPGAGHLLGRDELGRDILSRLIHGARISLLVGVGVVGLSLTTGLLIGAVAGYYGGWLDRFFNVIVINTVQAFPGVLLAIALVAFLGQGLGKLVIALSLGGWIGYVAGLYNATKGLTNESDGFLYGGRLESAPLGAAAKLRPGPFRLVVGGGALHENGATVNTFAASGDAHAEFRGARLRGEILFDRRTPDAEPDLPPTIPGEVKRIVAVGEATMFVWKELLEAAVRYEWYDNNRDFEDFGDQQLITGGLNVYILGHQLKTQLNYVHRDERKGRDIKNDAALISVTGIL